MRIYQFLFFDPNDNCPILDLAECTDDGAAAQTAAEQLAQHGTCRGVDVFENDRLVMRLERPTHDVIPGDWSIHGLH